MYYFYDEKGEYNGCAPCGLEDSPPDNCIMIAPKEKPGFIPVVNHDKTGWEYIEDRIWNRDARLREIADDLVNIDRRTLVIVRKYLASLEDEEIKKSISDLIAEQNILYEEMGGLMNEQP